MSSDTGKSSLALGWKRMVIEIIVVLCCAANVVAIACILLRVPMVMVVPRLWA